MKLLCNEIRLRRMKDLFYFILSDIYFFHHSFVSRKNGSPRKRLKGSSQRVAQVPLRNPYYQHFLSFNTHRRNGRSALRFEEKLMAQGIIPCAVLYILTITMFSDKILLRHNYIFRISKMCFYIGKNACSFHAFFGILKLCRNNLSYAFFVRSFGCALFCFYGGLKSGREGIKFCCSGKADE